MDNGSLADLTTTATGDSPPPWLDTAVLLPDALRRRVEHALVDARQMQRMVAEFYREHSAVFHDYAEATADPSTPDDVWEILDRLSGYAALWINVLATEAILGSMLEDRTPTAISPRAAADPASSRTSQVSEVPYL